MRSLHRESGHAQIGKKNSTVTIVFKAKNVSEILKTGLYSKIRLET